MGTRLGYACINTVISSLKICCNKTCRLDTAVKQGEKSGYDKGSQQYSLAIYNFLKGYATPNLKAMYKTIIWSKENNILFYRMSSDMFPHIGNLKIREHMTKEHWKEYLSLHFALDIIYDIGKYVQKYGIRLSMHPDHFNQLASPKNEVVKNTFTDLI